MLNSTYCKLFWYRPPKEDLHYRGSIFGDCLTRSKHWKSRDYWEKGSHCYLCYLRFSESCRTRFWAYQPETCHFITLSCITAWNNWSVGFCLEAVGWWHLNLKLWFSKSLMCHRIIVLFRIIAPSLRFFVEFMTKKINNIPWSQRFLLTFHRMHEWAAARKKNLWSLWTSISLSSCWRQLSNVSNHVLISR